MNSIATTARPEASAPKKDSSGPIWRTLSCKTSAVLRKVEPHGQATLLISLRLMYGWFFAQAGLGKLQNVEGTAGFFESLGLPAPVFMVVLVGLTELLGGVLLVAGAGARLAAAALAFTMGIAYVTAHAQEAFVSLEAFTEQSPFPFLVTMLVILAFGAGHWSVDAQLKKFWAKQPKA